MCGICGIYNFSNAPIDRQILEKMTRSLVHRGPDSEGFYINTNIGVGHRRLAIIDLFTGNQPMYSNDKAIVIVYNGEIYNYIELRNELKSLGYQFLTESDTEVIIYAYKEWGVDFQTKLNGMWAFAIWDNNKKELLLSRDRLGEKPLYYAVLEGVFLFGSEIKSILTYGVPKEARWDLIEIYLTLGYIPAPFTFYKGIHKLKPGHFIIVKERNIKEYRYWDLPEIDERNMLSNKNEIYGQFEYLLRDSVKLRMRSDVPFGAFLSGGLDSAGIVALMSQMNPLPVETFTIGFNSKEYDERYLASIVARRFNTNHHEYTIDTDVFSELVDKTLFHCDEAFGDSSVISTAYVSRHARSEVKMALSGDGGDEVLSGYTTYQGEKLAFLYQTLPCFLRRALPEAISHLSTPIKGNLRYKINRAIKVFQSCNVSFNERLIEKSSWIELQIIKLLLGDSLRRLNIEDFFSDFMKECSYKDNFYRIMYFNLKLSLPDDMLVKVDRMSMAHSLEVRIPFLDHRLVEFMVKVDKNVKMQGYERKSIFRRTLGKRLPSVLLCAPKRGFVIPLREWFKRESFNDELKQIFHLSRYGLNKNILENIIEDNKKGKYDYGNFIWMLIILNRWLGQQRGVTI